jgi:hypothetical protein
MPPFQHESQKHKSNVLNSVIIQYLVSNNFNTRIIYNLVLLKRTDVAVTQSLYNFGPQCHKITPTVS